MASKEPALSRHSNAVSQALSSIFGGLGRDLVWFKWWLESKTIIPVVEGLMRLWYHLDPRVYSQPLRIKRIADGQIDRKSDKYAIFVLYAKATLPGFTANLVDAIGKTPFNLVIVSNGELEPMLRAELLEKCHVLIERTNHGRDFGGYRDGIGYVLAHHPDAQRLLLVNDSLFFFARGLDKLLADLDGAHDFIGVTEVLEFHYHVQSYMMSFGRSLIQSRQFRAFWRKYRPISTRRWSIHKGEVGFTRKMTRAGFRPHILFQAA